MRLVLILTVLPLLVLAQDTAKSLGESTAILEQAMAEDDINTITSTLAAMGAQYPKAEEPDQKAAVKLIGKAAKSKRLPIRHGAFATLGVIKAKGSSKYLKKWLNPPNKFKKEIPPTYIEAIRAAGKIADASTLATLKKLWGHYELTIAQVALVATGGYHTLSTKRRKALAFELVRQLQRFNAKQRRKQSEDVYIRKAAMARSTVQALKGVTGKDYATVKGWEGWMERAEKQRDPFN